MYPERWMKLKKKEVNHKVVKIAKYTGTYILFLK